MKSFIKETGLIFLLLSLLSTCQTKDSRIAVIFDTDANNEVDDQHALAYLLFNSNIFHTIGITTNTTFNGGNIKEQTKEAERVLRLCDSFDKVKLFPGSDGSFDQIKNDVNDKYFDGYEAVNFIIDEAKKKRNEKLNLIAVGKLTNIALALKREPSIIPNVKVIWLGSNYPDTGEYNLENDIPALNYVLNTDVELEIATVRYGGPLQGTAAVKASRAEIRETMPGLGPHIKEAITGRNGGVFHNFGDYSVNLFENIEVDLPDSTRSLFDMAAVAIVKNPLWAESKSIEATLYTDTGWIEQPGNERKIIIWENFNRDSIIDDFYSSMQNYALP